MAFRSFGDSITAGSGASPGSNSYFNLLNSSKTGGTNSGVSNACSGDIARTVTGVTPNPAHVHTLMIGTNDARHYKGDTAKQGYYAGFVRHIITWLSAPTLKKARTSGTAVFTGTWANPSGYNYGKYSTQIGATYEETFSGDTLYLGHLIQQAPSLDGSLADVFVDNVKVGEISAYAPGMLTTLNSGFASVVRRFSGFGAGAHTVKVEVKTAKILYVDYVAGSDDIDTAGFVLSNVIPMTAYALGNFGITDAIIQDYNAILSGIAGEFISDGLPLTLVDSYSVIDPLTDIKPAPDGVHPNNTGHADIFGLFDSAF